MSHQTYAETAVLVAVMNGDIAEADRLLAGFLPGELSEFERQVEMLADCIGSARARTA